ncbi:MAG: AMP-binding protein [Verrucomicrobiota bacterium]|jgi:acetyl-CoA synthetase|nr:AMP-binding protein [Verrucomicrobiota bacterium]
MIERYLPHTDFSSYEDFKAHYAVNVPPRFNFAYDVVDGWAEQDDAKPALVWMDDQDHIQRYSFGELKRLSNQAANLLAAQGIRKGDVVMLILRQRPEVWITMLALNKIGAVVIPASFLLTAKDIVYRVKAADIRMIVAVDDAEILAHLMEALPDCPKSLTCAIVGGNVPDGFLDYRAELEKASPEWEKPADFAGGNDPMLIYFSSGTTGMPKMILHDCTHPLGHIVTAKYWQHVEEGGLHLTASDSGWAKFGWGKIYGQWICGAVVAAYDTNKFDPLHMLHVMETLQLTTFCAPATLYRFLIKEDLAKYDFSSIKQCSIAGEPLNPEVFNQWKKLTGMELVEGFGQSETSVLIANFGWDPIKPGSTGMFSPLYDAEIVDENGRPCEDGVVGRIVVRHTDKRHPLGLFREYYRDPAAMAASWPAGTYDTGDMAWRDGDGYIWFVGRSDDIIKCSGYRIGPFEVESALMEHPSVLECAVTAAPDPTRGQVVKATIVLAKGRGYEPCDELVRELQDHVKRITAPYKYPRLIEFVDALPKTASGKIRHSAIRQQSGNEAPPAKN